MPATANSPRGDLLAAGEKDVALVPREPDSFIAMIERLAANPDVDVAKLEKLVELQERIMRHNAEAAFNAAFAKMRPELPQVVERGQILVKGQLRSTYARLEDIDQAVTPILAKHGFGLRHKTQWPADKPGIIRIIGVLCHEQGHTEQSEFEAPMDKSDYRTDIQSQGSTVSYGRRYTTLDLLNITTRGVDNDGQNQRRPEVKAPEGFDNWWLDMQAVADEGQAKLQASWNASKPDYKRHLISTNQAGWESLKRKAASVKVPS